MNTNVTAADIQRQLDQLDREFSSPENCKTGRLDIHRYTKRQSELRERLRDAEQEAEQEAKRLAQTRRAAPSAQHYVMPTADVKQLRKMDLAFEAALDAGDQSAALEILQSKDYLRLLYLDELEDAGELGVNAYAAASGARSTLATRYISLSSLRRRALEARIATLENAIPRYCGTYKAGEHYPEHSICTDHGSMWYAKRSTSTRPPGDDWTMCVRGTRS